MNSLEKNNLNNHGNKIKVWNKNNYENHVTLTVILRSFYTNDIWGNWITCK